MLTDIVLRKKSCIVNNSIVDVVWQAADWPSFFMIEASISQIDPQLVMPLFGVRDQHLKSIRDTLKVDITHKDGELRITGEPENLQAATTVIGHLEAMLRKRGMITPEDVSEVIATVTGSDRPTQAEAIDILNVSKQVKPRTEGQAGYTDAIRKHDVVFAIGPAGTGKTYLAVAMAVEALKQEQIRKIVLVRPAVEAGESLGFLPGDLQAKINPYLRPLLDALHDMVDYEQIKRLIEQDVIEIVPLAYMRGRTLNDAFIILDEAQNTTSSQMKMFLTRMGANSRIVVAGDSTQVDLPRDKMSGLNDAMRRLKNIKGISFIRLDKRDIVRHRLVQDIVEAYDKDSRD